VAAVCVICESEATDAATPVTDITGVPTNAVTGTSLTLTGIVSPSNAFYKSISWTVKNSGVTGAKIVGNTLTATAPGTVTVMATIVDGLSNSTPFSKYFEISIVSFVPVTDIDLSRIPDFVGAGESLTLKGTVVPSNASCKDIIWSTNPYYPDMIDGNVLNIPSTAAFASGRELLIVTATITNGKAPGRDFTTYHVIEVKPYLLGSGSKSDPYTITWPVGYNRSFDTEKLFEDPYTIYPIYIVYGEYGSMGEYDVERASVIAKQRGIPDDEIVRMAKEGTLNATLFGSKADLPPGISASLWTEPVRKIDETGGRNVGYRISGTPTVVGEYSFSLRTCEVWMWAEEVPGEDGVEIEIKVESVVGWPRYFKIIVV